MILALRMPRQGELMQEGTILRILARPGDALRAGSPILEVRVDLSRAKAQDCPPVFHFRLMATERAVLRSLSVSDGDVSPVGAVLGVATTGSEESFDGPATRPLRTMAMVVQVDPLAAGR